MYKQPIIFCFHCQKFGHKSNIYQLQNICANCGRPVSSHNQPHPALIRICKWQTCSVEKWDKNNYHSSYCNHVDQISDLPTLPNKNNASLEEQLKQQQLLINKLTSHISALENHIQLLEGKVAIQETVSNLLEQKADDLEPYSRRPCTILSGIQKSKKESWENIKTSVLENLQKTSLPLEEIGRNIDKLHWVGKFDHETQHNQ